jgi:hypothetical protein
VNVDTGFSESSAIINCLLKWLHRSIAHCDINRNIRVSESFITEYLPTALHPLSSYVIGGIRPHDTYAS